MSNQLTAALLRAGFKQLPQTARQNVSEPDPKPTWGELSEAQRVYFLAAFAPKEGDVANL